MSEAVMVALVTAVGLVLSGVLVELVRARRRQDAVVTAVSPDAGASLRDAVDRVEREVHLVRQEQIKILARLSVVEARISDWLLQRPP